MNVDQWTGLIAGFALITSIVGTAAAFNSSAEARRSADVAEKQLAAALKKIGMVTEPHRMTEILPTWYIDRMAGDDWGFCLLLSSGSILAIQRIYGISDDGHWLEVALLGRDSLPALFHGHQVLYRAVDDRVKASVRVDQIQAAFEIMTS